MRKLRPRQRGSHSEPSVLFWSSLPGQDKGRPTDLGFDPEEMEKLGPYRQEIAMAKMGAGCVALSREPNLSEPHAWVRIRCDDSCPG